MESLLAVEEAFSFQTMTESKNTLVNTKWLPAGAATMLANIILLLAAKLTVAYSHNCKCSSGTCRLKEKV